MVTTDNISKFIMWFGVLGALGTATPAGGGPMTFMLGLLLFLHRPVWLFYRGYASAEPESPTRS